MKMIEIMGSCGSLVSINPTEILYFHQMKLLESFGTIMIFKNGKKIILDDDYDNIKSLVEEAQDDEV